MRALALLCILGCSSPAEDVPHPVMTSLSAPYMAPELHQGWHIVIDPAVPASHVEALTQALDEWQALAPCPFVYDVTIAPAPPFYGPWPSPGTIDIHAASRFPEGNEKAVGYGEFYPNGGSRVGLLPALPASDVLRVARHELGHAFHLPHAPSGVMYLYGQDGPMTALDVKAFKETWCP